MKSGDLGVYIAFCVNWFYILDRMKWIWGELDLNYLVKWSAKNMMQHNKK